MVAATGHPWTDAQLTRTRDAFPLVGYFRYESAPIKKVSQRLRKFLDPRFLNTNGITVAADDARVLEQLIDEHDVVWIHTLKLANAFRRYHWPKSVLDIDDYPSRFHASAAPLASTVRMKFRRSWNSLIWRRREALWRERFSILSVCKKSDKTNFGSDSRIHVIPNGFETPNMPADREISVAPGRIGMIGDFAYLPNADGLKWFIDSCWPTIKQRTPSAHLRLIGKSSIEVAEHYGVHGITGLGYVPETAGEISSWAVMIVPTRIGGGTHLKVAEGLARRVPIVTTSHGARGYDLEDQRDALIASAAPEFSSAVCRILEDNRVGFQIATKGWELFDRNYSWDAIRPAVHATIEACLAHSRRQ